MAPSTATVQRAMTELGAGPNQGLDLGGGGGGPAVTLVGSSPRKGVDADRHHLQGGLTQRALQQDGGGAARIGKASDAAMPAGAVVSAKQGVPLLVRYGPMFRVRGDGRCTILVDLAGVLVPGTAAAPTTTAPTNRRGGQVRVRLERMLTVSMLPWSSLCHAPCSPIRLTGPRSCRQVAMMMLAPASRPGRRAACDSPTCASTAWPPALPTWGRACV